MSYEVLARKWRPLAFDDVVGQDHITRTLMKAVESQRISHAYLFSGPRGCGKTSTARILARVINCESVKKDGNPCNECASCTAVIRGNNLDVMEIDGASHTGVNEVRDLQESIGYAPSQHRNKVYIIDEVHMLSTHAFNALLKTLEEPPPHVYFVFATTAPQKIPDTIKSRCQRHHFKRLEISEIAGQLAAICKAEKVKHEEEALRVLARKADGSMRDGTSLLDQCVTSTGGNVTAAAVREILGIIDQETVMGFVESIAAGDSAAVLKMLDESINEGIDIQELASSLLEGFRDLMLLATPGDLSALLFRSQEEIKRMRAALARFELGDLVVIVERLCNVTPRLKSAADPRILLESMLVDLSLLDRQTDIRELIARFEGASGGEVSSTNAGARRRGREALTDETPPPGAATTTSVADIEPAPRRPAPPVRAEPAGAAEDELDLRKLQELWDGFVTFVRQKKVSLGVCLISGRLHAFDGKRLSIRFLKNFSLQRDQVVKPSNLEFLRTMFARYFGREVEIVCFFEGDEPARRPVDAPAPAPGPAPGLVSDAKRPVLDRLIREFDGEIIR